MTAEARDPVALPPAGLRERVLAASRRARAAGRPDPAGRRDLAGRGVQPRGRAFTRLLGALGDADWARPALRDLDVQGLVGHLIGVEEDVHRVPGRRPGGGRGRPRRVHPGRGGPPGRARPGARPAPSGGARPTAPSSWSAAVADPGAEVAVHGMRLPLGALLVVRAFELWMHDNDIRRAAGLPPSVPDASDADPDDRAAARLLPYAAARTGLRRADQRAPGADRAGRRHLGCRARSGRGGARSGPRQHRHRRGRVLPAGRQPGRPGRPRPARHRRPRRAAAVLAATAALALD